MLKFLEHRIADQRVLALIRKWLKAGVIENGVRSDTEEGTAQGAGSGASRRCRAYARWFARPCPPNPLCGIQHNRFGRGGVGEGLTRAPRRRPYLTTFRLLLCFAREQTGKQPFELDLDDLDAPLIGAFLTHLEHDRGNSPRTRNARLGAIHSFYRFAALEHPEHAATIARVMAIPTKRYERNTVSYVDLDEIKALLAAPDRGTWLGRRDHALLLVMIQTGVRVSELVGLRVPDVHLGAGAHCRVTGKGRKKRATTLTGETAAVLRQWLKERQGDPDDPLFPTRQGQPLSRYTVGALLSKHATTAAANCPSLTAKRVTPHTLRHYVDEGVRLTV